MGKRATKSTALRGLEGGRSHSLAKSEKVAEEEVTPRNIMPDCPDYLGEEAVKFWDKHAPIAHEMGTLKEADGDAFGVFCQVAARLIAIGRFIDEENPSMIQTKTRIDSVTGAEDTEFKTSPYVVMEKQYMQLFRMYAKEFGFTPVGRVGLTAPKPKGGGGIGELLD
jgi:P27 family predicted phage terminase small subunit